MTPEARALERAYARVVTGRAALMLAAAAAVVLLTAADFALAVMALWVVPHWPAVALVLFLCGEAAVMAGGHGPVGLDLRRPPPPWWLAGNSLRFWAGLTGRCVFAVAEFAVLAHWLGHPLGFVLAACLTILALGARSAMTEAAARWQQAVSFAAPPEA